MLRSGDNRTLQNGPPEDRIPPCTTPPRGGSVSSVAFGGAIFWEADE